MLKSLSLTEFIIDRQSEYTFASGELTRLLNDIVLAAKIVNREVNKAGLSENILGSAGNVNVQGEEQKKLDVVANDLFIKALTTGGECCAIGSEENDDLVVLDGKDGKYLIAIDPLDGSSNIDVNVSIGTIFSIYRRLSESGPATVTDFLQKGVEQVAAGYVIYGSSTMLVYTTGNGVNGFTLDPSIGEFCLSHPNMKIPEMGKIYSINEGNILQCPAGVKEYVNWCQQEDKATNRPYSARYIGSLVADFHRNLLKGGIYIYPSTHSSPSGKLRLMYEANPLAFIVEQAGGKASNGHTRIMDLNPEKLHQRTPLFIGSMKMVEQAEQLLQAAVTA